MKYAPHRHPRPRRRPRGHGASAAGVWSPPRTARATATVRTALRRLPGYRGFRSRATSSGVARSSTFADRIGRRHRETAGRLGVRVDPVGGGSLSGCTIGGLSSPPLGRVPAAGIDQHRRGHVGVGRGVPNNQHVPDRTARPRAVGRAAGVISPFGRGPIGGFGESPRGIGRLRSLRFPCGFRQ
jgi:hypothetical protein